MKSSDNQHYRVSVVYNFIGPNESQELEITRTDGPPREDRFVVQWADVPDEEVDPKAPFKAGAQAGEVILPVNSE